MDKQFQKENIHFKIGLEQEIIQNVIMETGKHKQYGKEYPILNRSGAGDHRKCNNEDSGDKQNVKNIHYVNYHCKKYYSMTGGSKF